MTLTAIRPLADMSNGREALVLSVDRRRPRSAVRSVLDGPASEDAGPRGEFLDVGSLCSSPRLFLRIAFRIDRELLANGAIQRNAQPIAEQYEENRDITKLLLELCAIPGLAYETISLITPYPAHQSGQLANL